MRKLTIKAINLTNNTIEDLVSESCTILDPKTTDKTRTGGKHLEQVMVVSFSQVKEEANKLRGVRNFMLTREKLHRLENGETVSWENGLLLKSIVLEEIAKTK